MCAVRMLCLFALWASLGCTGAARPDRLPNDTFLGGEFILADALPRPQGCTVYVALPGGLELEAVPRASLSQTPVTIQRDLGEVTEDSSLFWLTDDEVEPYANAFDRKWMAWVGCRDADGAEAWGAQGGEEAVPFDVPSDGLSIAVDLLNATDG
jgi:hypothetical protein